MNVADFRAEMEGDLAWRQDEIRFFQNLTVHVAASGQEDQFRRALVVLLYAHFEGYCKFALSVYVNAVNQVGLPCRDANFALTAASLGDVLAALRNPSSKCDEFRNSLPDDSALHLFAREREFVERTTGFEARKVAIPDGVVDMESNLKPIVLRKNLYRLGLPLDTFEPVEGQINRLLNSRNQIAHGESKSGIPLKSYEELRDAVYTVMQSLTIEVTKALIERRFLRSTSVPAGN